MAKDFLRFAGVGFGYETALNPFFINLNLHFSPGWTGVVGAHGSGKSTLLRLFCGELLPLSGSISGPPLAVYCPQRTDHPPAGLRKLMTSPGREAALLKSRLGLEEDWPARWPGLSHGERRRLQIGAALFQSPDLPAVDEPTNHLDALTRDTLLGVLADFRGSGLWSATTVFFWRR